MYIVITDADGKETRSEPMPLNAALEYLCEAAKRISNTGGFSSIELVPAE